MAVEQDLQNQLDQIGARVAALPAPHVSVINASTVVTDAQLTPVVAALQLQVSRDVAPIWGVNVRLTQTKTPPANTWWLSILDDADQAGALGYHDVTSQGLPLGKVFAKTTMSAGDQWSVTASHELIEMLGDPEINLCAFVSATRLYAYELADACELDGDGYTINGIAVSDFVTPAWFGTGSTGPFDFKQHITAALQLRAGGYIGYMDVTSNGGWQQLTADLTTTDRGALMRARAPVGSRRERRRVGREQWIRSTAHAV